MRFFNDSKVIKSEDMDYQVMLVESPTGCMFVIKGTTQIPEVIYRTSLAKEYAIFCYEAIRQAIPEYKAIEKRTLVSCIKQIVRVYERMQKAGIDSDPAF